MKVGDLVKHRDWSDRNKNYAVGYILSIRKKPDDWKNICLVRWPNNKALWHEVFFIEVIQSVSSPEEL